MKETVIGACFFGLFWNISETVSEQIGWLHTTWFVKVLILIFLFLFSSLSCRKLNIMKSTKKTKAMILIMGFVEAGAVAIVNFGLTVGDAILITPIASALSVVTISMAVLFLKDRVSRLQGMGMLIAVSGIIVTGF